LKRQTANAGDPVASTTAQGATTGKPAEASRDTVPVKATGPADVGAATARTLLRPTVTGAMAIRTAHKAVNGIKDGPSITALVDELSEQCKAVSDGNMARPEALLTAQAHTLDTLFSDLVRRAYSHRELDPFERIMRLALKVQSQSRATVETLATVKNPPMVFAKQANVTTGPQQVNNGVAAPIPPRARDTECRPTELLENMHGSEWLDAGTADAASGGDSPVEAVGAVYGAENAEG
jgi:hypothetical protein